MQSNKSNKIVERFRQTVKNYGNKKAVSFAGSELTYQELDVLSNHFAAELVERGQGSGDIIAILSGYSPHAIIAILAILKIGAAYLPLNTKNPAEYNELLLNDANVTMVLVSEKVVSSLSKKKYAHLTIFTSVDVARSQPLTISNHDANSPGYIFYTSGTTGKPKGVIVNQQEILNHIDSFIEFFNYNQNEHYLGLYSLAFDASVEMIFPILFTGGTIYFCDDVNDLKEINKLVKQYPISILDAPPSLLSIMNKTFDFKELSANLRLVLTGGDKLEYSYIDTIVKHVSVANGYGVTEAVVSSLWHIVDNASDQDNIPIGKPLSGVKLAIVDSDQQAVEDDQCGELYIGGDSLAAGYLNNPVQTDSAFIRIEGERFYKTGDLASKSADGVYYYFGRKDHQISLNGFRVEPAEIEVYIKKHLHIEEPLVLCRNQQQEKFLVCFYSGKKKVAENDAIKALSVILPNYKIPSRFIALEKWPLTSNGKIDRKALHAIPLPSVKKIKYVKPDTVDEKYLAELLISLLNVKRVGLNDNLFSSGINSLKVIQLLAIFNEKYSSNISVLFFFENPTISSFLNTFYRLKKLNADESVKFVAAKKQELMPISVSQQQLIFIDKYYNDKSSAYNIAFAIRMNGKLDYSILEQSFNILLQRHEILRTHFVEKHGQIYQVANNQAVFELDTHAIAADTLIDEMRDFSDTPFNLYQDRLIRVRLFKISKLEHVLAIVQHHTITDGWSIGIIKKELATLYNCLLQNQTPTLAESLQYSDFACWQINHLKQDFLLKEKAFWQDYLKNSSEINIPAKHVLTTPADGQGDRVSFVIDKRHFEDVKAYAINSGITPFMLFLSTIALLLKRYSGENNIIIGVPFANRVHQATHSILGFFVNALPIHINLAENPTIDEMYVRVKKSCLEIFDHQEIPFGVLVDLLNVQTQFGKNPLFQTLFTFQNANATNDITFNNLDISEELISPRFSKLDLSFEFIEEADQIIAEIEYNATLFDREMIFYMKEHFLTLLESQIANKKDSKPVDTLNMLSNLEIKETKNRHMVSDVSYDKNKTLHQLIAKQAKLTPEHIALMDDNGSLTYASLEQHSNALAKRFYVNGVRSDDIVGVYFTKSIDYIVTLLAIMKIGATYLPLDANYPEARIKFILDDSGARNVIVKEGCANNNKLANSEINIINFNDITKSDIIDPLDWEYQATPSRRLYLMYTSGTTGTPKGVAISHQNVVNLLQSYAQELSLKPDHRCFSITSMVFDISGLEVYLPLITGSSVYLAHPNALLNVDYVNSVITKNDLTWMQATPSFYRLLVDAGWKPKNLTLLVGGEALNRSLLVDLLADDIKILNCYGPTETTIWSSCAWIAKHDEITIGKPIANTRIYILDNHLQILPVGVPGEIYIAGDGLSAGYHNRPALNEERFVILQLPHAKKERVYKTGDLGYLTPHGSIKYLGRTDSQIKFQGHRVELTEIENTAMQYPAIKQAVVLPSSSADKIDKLIAHIVYHELLQPHQPSFDFSLFYFSSTQSTSDKIYNLLIEGAKFADNHGFSAVWTPERHFHPIGGHFPNPSITSAALSLITKNIQLRAGSVVLPLHSPLRVAEEWSAVDNFSNGRVAVAFASGWNPKDFALAPDVYEKRHALMPKYIDDVQALWAGKSISMKDGNGKIAEVSIYPRPVQATLPMWVTVRGDERTIINAAKAGANLLTHLIGQPLNLLAERIKKYRETLQEHGHDSKSKKVTVMLHAFIWSNFEDAVKHAREPFLAYLREHVAFEIMASSVQDQAEINAEDKEAIIEAAFQRYISTASLIGDVAHCQQIIQNLIGAGVDEVACFIDFGIEEHLVISSFEYLNELKEKVKLIKTPDCSELDSFLKSRLPDIMVPKSYVVHKKLPLTINGKIDHTALKMIDVNLIKQTEKHAKIKRQPETRLEQALAKLWCEIIVIEEVYQDDNFFDVGGYSLLVVQLLAKIKYNFNVSLSVKELYANLTIKSLGALLQEKITDELAVH